jgi:hypothetical protein
VDLASPRCGGAQDWVRDFALPVAFLACYLVFKAWLAQSSTQAPGLRVSLATHLHNIAHGLRLAFVPGLGIEGSLAHSPVGFLLATPVQIVFLMAVLAGAVVLILRGTFTQRFLLASAVLMIIAMTLGVGSVASRHHILISAPAVILWVSLLADLTRYAGRLLTRLGTKPEVVSVLRFAPAALAIAVWVFFGVQYAILQQDAWKAAAARVDQLVAQIDQFIGENPSADTLYLIDMPDSAPSPTGDYDDRMYMFRNSPPSLIRLTHPHRFRLSRWTVTF